MNLTEEILLKDDRIRHKVFEGRNYFSIDDLKAHYPVKIHSTHHLSIDSVKMCLVGHIEELSDFDKAILKAKDDG